MAGPESVKKKAVPTPQDAGTEQTFEDEEVVTGDDGIFGIPACSKSKLKSFSDVFLCSKTIIDLGFEIKKVHGEEKETPLPILTPMVLPTEYDPQAATYQTIESIPVCDMGKGPPTDKRFFSNVQRVWYTDEGIEKVTFARPGEVEQILLKYPGSKSDVIIHSPNDDIIRKIQADKNILSVENAEEIPGQNEKVVFYAQYYLCRSNAKEPAIWVYARGPWLKNYCSDNKSGGIPLITAEFTDYEIKQIISGNLGEANYCIDHDNSHLSIINNADTALALLDKIKQSTELTPEQKTKIEQGIHKAFSGNILSRKTVEDDTSFKLEMRIGNWLQIALTGLFIYYIRQSNQKLDKLDEKVDVSKFLEDHTEKAKDPNYSQLVNEEEDLRKITRTTLKSQMKNILISGSAGSGKSETIRGFFHRVATGAIEHLKGYKLYSFNAENFSGAGAKWAGNFEKALAALLEKANTEPCIIYIEEAHLLVGMGTTEGKPSDILDLLKRHMSNPKSKIIIIFDTNKPEGFLKDPALAGRVTHIIKGSPTFAKALEVFDKIYKKFTNGFKITEEAKKAILHLAGSHERGRIAGAIDLLQDLIADKELEGQKKGSFGEEEIIRFFAAEHKMSEGAVRALIELSKAAEEAGTHPEAINTLLKALKGASEAQITQVTGVGKRPKGPEGPKVPKGPDDLEGPKGPEDGPPSPPAASAGGNAAAPADDKAAAPEEKGGGEEAKRVILILESEVSRITGLLDGAKGFVTSALPFVAMDVAEHYGWMTPGQKSVGIVGWTAGMTFYVNPYTPAHLALMYAPFALSQHLTTKAAEATGIDLLKEGTLGNKIAGTLGGFAGVAAVVRATGGAEVWNQAAINLQNGIVSRIGSVGMTIEEELASGFSQAAVWVRNAGQQGYLAIPAGTAIAAGAKAGAVQIATTLTTPISLGVAATAAIFTGAAAAGAAMGAGIYYSGLGGYIGTDWVGAKTGVALADTDLGEWYYNHFLK